jgi:WD40 repeat protein
MSVLRDNCLSCHNPEKKKGKLLLTSRAEALRGNEDGPALVPGKPDESLMVKVLAPDADPHMPPKKQLAAADVAAVRAWVEAGAPWDESVLNASAPTTRRVELRGLPATYQPVLAVALSPDDTRLAAGRGNRVYVYDTTKSQSPVVRTLGGPRDAVQSLAWSADGQFLAAGDYGRVTVWDLRSPDATKLELTGLAGRVTALLFLPGGHTLLAADGGPAGPSRLVRYELPATEPKQIVASAHDDTINALACTGDGSLFASGGADKLVKLWQAATLKEQARLEGHSGHVLALAFNPDGSRLASGGTDREVKVWDVATREQKTTIGPHPAAVTALAWAEGTRLYAAGEDGVVRTDNATAKEVGRALPAAGDVLYALAISKDGKRLFAGCHDGRVYVWNADGKLQTRLGGESKPAQP